MTLYRISSEYFVCGIIADDNDNVLESAPIVYYSKKLGLKKFLDYCQSKNWQVEKL
jgi:hypothetical protein